MLGKAFEPFLKTLMTRRFQQGSILVYQGEVPGYSYILKAGTVKLYNITQQGDERIAAFRLPGDIFPTTWSFDQTPSAFYYYEAQTDGEMYVASRDDFLQFIDGNSAALRTLADYYVGNYAGALMRITALEQPKAIDKVLYTLYYLMQCYGKAGANNIVVIQLQLTQQLMADLIGLTRETTAAELVKLKKHGILTYKGREYSVDREKLIKMIGEDNFKELRI